MEFKNIKTYNNAPERVFEIICSQIFEGWLRREFSDIKYFSVVNGSGGDGGVEAYAEKESGDIIGLQAKWFPNTITDSQIRQIEKSIKTARIIRPNLSHYIICIPRETSSKKKGKGGEIIKVTEEMKLVSLVNKMKGEHSNLAIEIWKPSTLFREFAFPENDGLKRFWFEKEELSFNTLKVRFSLANEGWLSNRYFPALHNQKDVADLVDEILVTDKFINGQISHLKDLTSNLVRMNSYISDFIKINKAELDLNKDLKEASKWFSLCKFSFEQFLNELNDNKLPDHYPISDFELFPLYTNLRDLKVSGILKETQHKLSNLLFSFHNERLPEVLTFKRELFKPHNQIILGPVGSGKTHALAFEVENKLKEGYPALLIRAKDCNTLNWQGILSESLGCYSDWSDLEILKALCSIARIRTNSRASKNTKSKTLNHSVRFLICIDGIDESPNPQKWRDLINETKVWLKEFPEIRFIFSCRNYHQPNDNPHSLPFDKDKLRRTDIFYEDNDLAEDYLDHFEIKYLNTPWILNSFENGLSLRLFCEKNAGSDLSMIYKNPVFNSSYELLSQKIVRLEEELCVRTNENSDSQEQIINRALTVLVDYFYQNNQVKREFLVQLINSNLDGLLSRKQIGILLNLLCDYGFLSSYVIPNNEDLITEHCYEFGIKTYFDYLLAKKISKEIIENDIIAIPEILLNPSYNYVRELTALDLLVQHKKLIGENGLWVSDFSQEDLLILKLKAFSLAPRHTILDFWPSLEECFLNNRDIFIENFVIPNIDREDLNIVENLVHKTLLAFKNNYERDLFWSGPDDYTIRGNSHLSFIYENISIFLLARFNHAPLLNAWLLSSTSKYMRNDIREDLTRWASHNLEGFVKLLDKIFFTCGDNQIQEDLSIVIYGLGSLISVSSKGVEYLIQWIDNNIFDSNQIIGIKNSIIRHGNRCFIDRAYNLQLCSREVYKRALPPYEVNPEERLTIYTEGKIFRDGLYPIEHDLYWHTIKEAFDSFTDYYDQKLCSSMKNFLDEQKASNMSPNEFFTRVALKFIWEQGWNKHEGRGDIGGQDYMTYEEKYTLLAVHFIQGYLADRLPILNCTSTGSVDDYGNFIDLLNPAHKEAIKVDYLHRESTRWYIPEELSPIIDSTPDNIKKDIACWTKSNFQYDFTKWLFPKKLKLLRIADRVKDKWFVLNHELYLTEPNDLGRAWIKMDCLLLKKTDFLNLKDLLAKGNKDIKTLAENLHAGIDKPGSVSLIDVILRKEIIKEYDDEIFILKGRNALISGFSTVTEVSESNDQIGGQNRFFIPSFKIRELLGIETTDKKSFFDEKGEISAILHGFTENTANKQHLVLADFDKIHQALEENELCPIWICKEFRSTSDHEWISKYKAHKQNCRIWIYTLEDGNSSGSEIYSGYYSVFK